MGIKQLRYIVFLLNTEVDKYDTQNRLIETQDGMIFCNKEDARSHAVDAIDSNLCNRFVIGLFCMDIQAERMGISMIESFGFKKDKKNVSQLSLFGN